MRPKSKGKAEAEAKKEEGKKSSSRRLPEKKPTQPSPKK